MDKQALRDQHYNATVVSIDRIHESLLRMKVLSDDGPLPYQAGQYTTLGLGGWEDRHDGPSSIEEEKRFQKVIKRAYSISCPLINEDRKLVRCSDYHELEFYITLVDRPDQQEPKRPPLTPRIFALDAGDRIQMSQHVVGHYTLHDYPQSTNYIFAATGTGEAPHNAMIAELLANGHTGNIVSLTCTRFVKDAAYYESQQILSEIYNNYQYCLLTTREDINLNADHPEYVGKQYIQSAFQGTFFLDQFGWTPQAENTHVYLCGNPDMIGLPEKDDQGVEIFPKSQGVAEILVQQGFALDHPREPGTIHFEKYW